MQPLAHEVGRKSSSPTRFLNRRSSIATSSRQSMPSILKVDSACSSQTVQVVVDRASAAPLLASRLDCSGRRPSSGEAGSLLLHVLEPLLEQADDVLVVEGVVDMAAVAARTHQAHAAQQPELVGHRRLGEAEHARRGRGRSSSARASASRMRTRVSIAEHLEGFGQGAMAEASSERLP